MIDQFTGNEDDSTCCDSIELWETEIAFMMRPTVNSPADIEFAAGGIGHSAVWTPESYHPPSYQTLRNESPEVFDDWNGSRIVFSLYGLEVGVYEYEVIVYDFIGNSAADAAIVSPGDALSLELMLFLVTGGVGVAIIVILALVFMRYSS